MPLTYVGDFNSDRQNPVYQVTTNASAAPNENDASKLSGRKFSNYGLIAVAGALTTVGIVAYVTSLVFFDHIKSSVLTSSIVLGGVMIVGGIGLGIYSSIRACDNKKVQDQLAKTDFQITLREIVEFLQKFEHFSFKDNLTVREESLVKELKETLQEVTFGDLQKENFTELLGNAMPIRPFLSYTRDLRENKVKLLKLNKDHPDYESFSPTIKKNLEKLENVYYGRTAAPTSKEKEKHLTIIPTESLDKANLKLSAKRGVQTYGFIAAAALASLIGIAFITIPLVSLVNKPFTLPTAVNLIGISSSPIICGIGFAALGLTTYLAVTHNRTLDLAQKGFNGTEEELLERYRDYKYSLYWDSNATEVFSEREYDTMKQIDANVVRIIEEKIANYTPEKIGESESNLIALIAFAQKYLRLIRDADHFENHANEVIQNNYKLILNKVNAYYGVTSGLSYWNRIHTVTGQSVQLKQVGV